MKNYAPHGTEHISDNVILFIFALELWKFSEEVLQTVNNQ